MSFTKRSVFESFSQLILIVIFFSFFKTISGDADILNVKDISPGGTIQYVIDTANEGDTIFLPEGTYKEQVRINKSLVLKGEGKYKTRWEFIREENKKEDKGSVGSILGFIKRDKKEEEEEYPGGIKIMGDNVTLTIEDMQLHCIENLNTINLNRDSQTNAVVKIKDCLFTSNEDSLPSIYAQKAIITITDSVFKKIKSTGIRLEDGCKLRVENVNFVDGGDNHSSIYLEKSTASITESIFKDVQGMCVTVVGNKSYSELKGCGFSNSGSIKYPLMSVKDKAETVVTDCVFENSNGSSIIIENEGRVKLEGRNEFYGKSNMREPLIKIINGEAILGGSDSDSMSVFSNIDTKGIQIQEGTLFANNCQFQGNAKKATFIDCKKGILKVKRCDFGDNKECIIIDECNSVHVESCNFGRSQSHPMQIKNVNGTDNSLILECTFVGSNDSSIKVEGKSKLFIRLCTFKGGNTKNSCIHVDDSHVTFIRCFFEDINTAGIKGIRGSNISVKGCEFSSQSDGDYYAIYIEDKSNADIANCTFSWNNNKLFYAKDCEVIKFEGISPEYKKLRK